MRYLFREMEQQDAALHRQDDPDTSKQAAEEISERITELQAECLARCRRLCVVYGNATANEIASGDDTIRKRVHEIRNAGKVRIVGKRRCRVTGKTCQVYEVV